MCAKTELQAQSWTNHFLPSHWLPCLLHIMFIHLENKGVPLSRCPFLKQIWLTVFPVLTLQSTPKGDSVFTVVCIWNGEKSCFFFICTVWPTCCYCPAWQKPTHHLIYSEPGGQAIFPTEWAAAQLWAPLRFKVLRAETHRHPKMRTLLPWDFFFKSKISLFIKC